MINFNSKFIFIIFKNFFTVYIKAFFFANVFAFAIFIEQFRVILEAVFT
jgi:hypothetical protein